MHEHHPVMEPDENFETGTLSHLIAGNEGRVLDGRRTPGCIERFDTESCMFIWKITAFEDAGKCWEIPAEQISSYQFRIGSTLLSQEKTEVIRNRCRAFQTQLVITRTPDQSKLTQDAIAAQEIAARGWIEQNSSFFQKKKRLDFQAQIGDPDLFCDLQAYLKSAGVSALEQKTADQYLLNPNSGEWIKGMKITMAQLGLIDFHGTIPRTKDIFCGIGEKALRRKYIVARAAFVRTMFKLSGHAEVPLFRGIASEVDFFHTPGTLLSATFSAATAKAFASIENAADYRTCCYAKFFYPVDCLFMTFFETRQLNERYQEQEAILFYQGDLPF